MLRFTVTEDRKIILNNSLYLLEAGDTMLLENANPMFPIEYAQKVIEKTGKTVGKLIGQGENGYAFKNGNKVLKVTQDDGEYLVSRAIIGKRLNHVVNIFDVNKVNMPLKKMPQWWIDFWGSPMPGWETLRNMYIIEKEYVNKYDNDQLDEIIESIEMGIDRDTIRSNYGELGEQLLSMISELNDLGISIYDIRGENIGVSGGKLKLFDLGGLHAFDSVS